MGIWTIAPPAGPSAGEEEERDRGEELAVALGWLRARGDFFDSARPLVLARAPGRLDVMGGFADYSGSLVLEYPLRQATWVAAQLRAEPSASSPGAASLTIESTGGVDGQDPASAATVTIDLDELTPERGPLAYQEARRLLAADPGRAWAAYLAGALVVLHHERGRRLPRAGAKLLVHSNVPAGIGLSSSAALEVAAFEALAALTSTVVDDRELALLAQMVENLVVGAPCGVMDQLTAACGRRDHLLEILCQPAEVRGHIPLPPGLELWALGSGMRHTVSGADYGSVRAAAFMGYRIISELAGLPVAASGPTPDGPNSQDRPQDRPQDQSQSSATVVVTDSLFGGYLANVSAALWHSRLRDHLPRQLDGAAFLARYGGSTDQITRIDPARTYAVRACTEHPILEHDRVRRFRDLLTAAAPPPGVPAPVPAPAATAASGDDRVLGELGELMNAAHRSYSVCGVGSAGTDRLVELVRAVGHSAGLYGAKITGGGSGGAVAVLARRGSARAIQDIASRYQSETGRPCQILGGSSDGSRPFGLRHLNPA